MAKNNNTKIVQEIIKPSDEELILGAKETTKTCKIVDYTAPNKLYKVTNLIKNRVYELGGREISAILGINTIAQEALRKGNKKVEITNPDTKEIKYIIEVIK